MPTFSFQKLEQRRTRAGVPLAHSGTHASSAASIDGSIHLSPIASPLRGVNARIAPPRGRDQQSRLRLRVRHGAEATRAPLAVRGAVGKHQETHCACSAALLIGLSWKHRAIANYHEGC